MLQSRFATLFASAAFVLSVGIGSAAALDLGGAVSGVTDGVSGAVGGVTGGVSNTLGTVTSAPSNTVGGASGGTTTTITGGSLLTADLNVLGSGHVLLVDTKILKSGIKARLAVLSTRDLLSVCVGVGGGGGCHTGSRSKLLGLIDTRLGVLSGRQLVSLCLNIGSSSCGIVGGGTGGGSTAMTGGSLLTADLDVLGSGHVLLVDTKILKSGIKARLAVLSARDLLTVCVGVGGGGGCHTGSRSELVGLIDTRLGVLSGRQLVSLCLNIGSSSCGSGGGSASSNTVGGASGSRSRALPAAIAGMSDSEIAVRQRQCKSILAQPASYERDLVQLCELLRRL